MAKVTGFKCDICNKAENGTEAPSDWLRLKLPNVSNGLDTHKDICSDKCLLKFAKERNGVAPRPAGKPGASRVNTDLVAYLDSVGVRPAQRGPLFRTHSVQRHEMSGLVEDCPICQFLSAPVAADA